MRLILQTILVCCSVWCVRAHGRCDSMLELPTEAPSLSEGNGDIHSRSLSPWTWRDLAWSDTQIPSILWEAECNSSHCSFPHSRQREGQTDGLSSVPIYQDVLVLQRKQGTHCFSASYRRLAVGCTCVRTPIATEND